MTFELSLDGSSRSSSPEIFELSLDGSSRSSSPEPQLTAQEALAQARKLVDKRIEEASKKAFYMDDARSFSVTLLEVRKKIEEILGSASDSPRARILRLKSISDDTVTPRGLITSRNVAQYRAILKLFRKALQPTTPPSPAIHRK